MDETENIAPTAFVLPLILFLVGVLLFMALLNNQYALTILCMLVFTMAAGAKAWSRLSLSRIRCDLSVDKRKMFPGEDLALAVRVENSKFLPIWLQVSIALRGSLSILSGETALKKDSGLLWYQRVSFNWQLIASRRGVHRIGPVRLVVADLLGFFPKKKQTTDFHDIIVYPRLVPLNPVLLPRRDFFGIPGARSPIEDPVYIHGTREYQHRRPARYIHWKASARHNRLQEKVCEPAEQEKILMVVCADGFAEDDSGQAFERCLEVVASLAVQFGHLKYAVGLATNGDLTGGGRATLPITRNPNHLSEILETLARLKATRAGDLVDILHRGLTLPWGVSCVCFRFRHDAASHALMGYFKHRNIPMVMIVGDQAADLKGVVPMAGEKIYRMDDIRAEGIETK